MLKVILFISILIFHCSDIYAQRDTIRQEIKEKMILFLIQKNQIPGDTADWNKFSDMLVYSRLFNNRSRTINEIYSFGSTSFHSVTYLLLRRGENMSILNTPSVKSNFQPLLDFLKENPKIKSSYLLEVISKILEVYESNDKSNTKIPTQ